jgi:hypothetical protein
MAKKQVFKLKTPIPSDQVAIDRYRFMDGIIRQPGANIDELERALGMYMVGHHFGWKVLHVIHSTATIRKYEAILGIAIIDTFDEIGPDADRTNAYKIIKSVSSFWDWLVGREKFPIDFDKRTFSD